MATYFSPPTEADVEAYLAGKEGESDDWSRRGIMLKLTQERIKTAIERCQTLVSVDPSLHNVAMAMQTMLDIAIYTMKEYE